MNKFPEAFKRFEEKVNFDNIETFQQLKLAFGSWAGRKWVPTCRQADALEREARKLESQQKGIAQENKKSKKYSLKQLKKQGQLLHNRKRNGSQ